MNTWGNGCFGKMDDLPAHTTPNHHLAKMDVFPKTFIKIILSAKWLARHSSTSPTHQRWPLPSLLSNSSSLDCAILVRGNLGVKVRRNTTTPYSVLRGGIHRHTLRGHRECRGEGGGVTIHWGCVIKICKWCPNTVILDPNWALILFFFKLTTI